MTYEEALQKINSRLRFGIKPGLERIEALCKKLGDPQKKPRFVHVAGTNGKGTTCTLIASVLTVAGYRTGLYTSPYVLDFRERFRIDGEMIPEAELIEEVKRVSPIADELEAAGDTVKAKLANEKFTSKAPQNVIDGVKANGEKLEAKIKLILETLESYQ